MSAVLGVSAAYHDAAAALVVDGTVVAAMQEERFSRRKNDPSLPLDAARACLRRADLAPGDLDAVVFYENPYARLERVLTETLASFPRSIRQFPSAMASQLGDKIWVLDQLAEQLAVDRRRVLFRDHHESHAASAFFTSPFERAAILTVDGAGEALTTAIWLGEGTRVTRLAALEYPHSIGLMYAALTAYLGFEPLEGEHKVMGLAAYGRPRFRDAFERLLPLAPDGSFEIAQGYFAFDSDAELGFGAKLEALLGKRRAAGAPWDLEGSDDDRRYADVAASLQLTTEEALLGLARAARQRTGADALCLAGGVALNAVANARILREAGFSRVFVHPAAGDAGGALGAALLHSIDLGGPRPQALTTAALGDEIDVDEARAVAAAMGLETEDAGDVGETVARLLARGAVVGLARGRFEWGPRALGQRSILASPRTPGVRARLARAIKRRDAFRPFAPAVLRHAADRYFTDVASNDMTSFMTTVCPVRSEARASMSAAMHIDGTARVQTVGPDDAPDLAAILEAMAHTGEDPVVLNTSLNAPREPICATATDAIGFFVAHPLDALVVGDVLVRRTRAT